MTSEYCVLQKPLGETMVKEMLYVPNVGKTWLGEGNEEVVPSPKLHEVV